MSCVLREPEQTSSQWRADLTPEALGYPRPACAVTTFCWDTRSAGCVVRAALRRLLGALRGETLCGRVWFPPLTSHWELHRGQPCGHMLKDSKPALFILHLSAVPSTSEAGGWEERGWSPWQPRSQYCFQSLLGPERPRGQEGMYLPWLRAPKIYVQSIMRRSSESPVDKSTSRSALKERSGRWRVGCGHRWSPHGD